MSGLRDALERARERGALKILYLGDFDPSGLLIEQVNERELGIKIKRIALTWKQTQKYKLVPRSVNRRDPRAKEYIERYGNQCWELEALHPNLLRQIVERELHKAVTREFLRERERRLRIRELITELVRI